MFRLIDPPVYEAPIDIDFNAWLSGRNFPTADMPTCAVRVTIVDTEWFGENDPDGKRPYQVDTRTIYSYGTSQWASQSEFAKFLQHSHPIPLVGVGNDVNQWYNLLSFAKQNAIDWRAKETKGQ